MKTLLKIKGQLNCVRVSVPVPRATVQIEVSPATTPVSPLGGVVPWKFPASLLFVVEPAYLPLRCGWPLPAKAGENWEDSMEEACGVGSLV